MSAPERSGRAFSFGRIASDYDRYRPGPPPAAVRWVLGEGRREVVLDLGAGTGTLTRMLVALVAEVIAAEPDAQMRAVLASRAGGAFVLGALGEHLPIATGTLDAVIASSSWHWMDPDLAGAEVARVLAPGGVFGLLWNGPDRRVPWVAEVLPTGRFVGTVEGDHQRRRTMVLDPALPFGEPETTVLRWATPADLDQLAGLAGTFSVAIVGGEDERDARVASARERAARVRPDSTAGPIDLPMACRCWRATRTGAPLSSARDADL